VPLEPRVFDVRARRYGRFDIASWWQKVKDEDSAIAFTTPVLTFVGDAIANGNSVLVHCLAGAHRAGTTGCLVIMHYAVRHRIPLSLKAWCKTSTARSENHLSAAPVIR
jgi:protein tyrosine phosphatase